MASNVPRFYMYKPPAGNRVTAAIEGALGTMAALQKMKSEGLTQEQIRQKIAREKEEMPLDILTKKQAIKREGKELPLDLRIKETTAAKAEKMLPYEIMEAALKPNYYRSETTKNQAQSGLYNMQQQKAHIDALRGQQMLDFTKQIMSEQAPNASGAVTTPTPSKSPISQGVGGFQIPPEASPGASQPGTPIMPNLSPMQQKMTKLADLNALAKGEVPPSVKNQIELQKAQMENAIKSGVVYPNELNKQMAKTMSDESIRQARAADTAQSNIEQLNQFTKYVKGAKIKGPIAGIFPNIAKWDPKFVEALKTTALLQRNALTGLAQNKLGRILQMEVDMLNRGIPDPTMTSEAAKEIAKLLKAQSMEVIAKNNLWQKYKYIIPDPAGLNTAINSIVRQNSYIDELGNVHEEAIKDWGKIATKERMFAEGNPHEFEATATQQGYDPDKLLEVIRNKSARDAIPAPKGISEEEIANMMNKYGWSRRQVINAINSVQGNK